MDKFLTREETIKALEACISSDDNTSCDNCPLRRMETYCVTAKDTSALFYLKEKEPAVDPTTTSPEQNKNSVLHINDNTKLAICQEALLTIGDRIAECADGDDYILGYVHAVLDVIGAIGLEAGDGDD
jgi:hypothetical protein